MLKMTRRRLLAAGLGGGALLLVGSGLRWFTSGYQLLPGEVCVGLSVKELCVVRSLGPARNVFAAPHPGGGACMGADPKTSVVGFDHCVHGTDNLYVADPSVFPTAPSGDPSLSIMAFSFVAADTLHSTLG